MAGDRVAASAGWGPFARWAGRRLFAAAEHGDRAVRADVARIAAMPDHRLRDRAREAVAIWWARDRDPFLRQVVLDVAAVAPWAPELLQTLALLGRLSTGWTPWHAHWAATLLADDDPGVREAAASACREASGPLLERLWREATAAAGPQLREALLANDDAPVPPVVDVLWADWIRSPSPRLGDALARWGRPAGDERHEALSVVAMETDPDVLNRPRYRRALITALTLGDHPLYGIAERKILALGNPDLGEEICAEAMVHQELVPFCKKHKLAPRDQVKRALFFLTTGQREQHSALDPDGSLLSLAYASASEEERSRAQRLMLTAGELDLVRVIVGDDRRARIPALSHGEVRYLAEQLAARREWADLWAIVQDVPIETGVELFRLFDGWAPRDDDTRRIFDMYLKTAPSAVTAALGHLRTDRPRLFRQARFLFHGRVNDVSFAPDGPYLAAAGTNRVAGVFDLRTARLVERYDGFNSSVGRILHTGNGTLIAGERTNSVERECRVMRCAGGGMQTLHTTRGSVTSLASLDDSGGFVAATRAGSLLLGASGAGPVASVPVGSLELGNRWARSVAAHPGSGRLAAVLGRTLVVADVAAPDSVVPLAACEYTWTMQAAFVGADSLVCAYSVGLLSLKRWEEGRLFEKRSRSVSGLSGLAASSALGEPVIVDRRGDLHVFDGDTLERTSGYLAPEPQDPTNLTVSRNGDFLAVGDAAGHTDLFDLRLREMPGIVRRPLVDLVPRHLGIVGTALADPALDPEAGAALQLLHACLEHRFRYDIEIGDAVRLTAGEHDISL